MLSEFVSRLNELKSEMEVSESTPIDNLNFHHPFHLLNQIQGLKWSPIYTVLLLRILRTYFEMKYIGLDSIRIMTRVLLDYTWRLRQIE